MRHKQLEYSALVKASKNKANPVTNKVRVENQAAILTESQMQFSIVDLALFFCVRGTRTQPLSCVGCSVHYWVSFAINKGGFFEFAFVVVVDKRLPRFKALACVFPHFDALTHMVIRVSSAFIFQTFAEVCHSVLVNSSSFKSLLNLPKAYIFKSLLNVYYRSAFNERCGYMAGNRSRC